MVNVEFKIVTHQLMVAGKNFFNAIRGVYPYSGNTYYCPVCKSNLKYFSPITNNFIQALEDFRFAHPIFQLETMTFAKYRCPKCKATDRDRLFVLYFNKKFKSISETSQLKLLDFAPQPWLTRFLKTNTQCNYRSADLYMQGVDDKVDIMNMDIYKDNTFDIFICSHILEHVRDQHIAIKELYRILKPSGWGIVMVPIMMTLDKTLEDPTIVDESLRWHHYMQDDHVRLFSKSGFIQDLKDGGFKVNQYGADFFGVDTFRKCGINPFSVLYIVEK